MSLKPNIDRLSRDSQSVEHTTMKEALILTAVFFALIAGIVAETREIHAAVVCGTIGC
jgi:hypothetical protein